MENILNLINQNEITNIKTLIFIDSSTLLNKISTNEFAFNDAMGLNTDIVDEGNENFTAVMFFGKAINENDFNTRFSANQRTKLLEYYKRDVDDLFIDYVDISGLMTNEIDSLKRKLILLCLRFQIIGILSELPVPPYNIIGQTLGLQKLLANITKYKKDYNITKLNKINKLSAKNDLEIMITNYFDKNKAFFESNNLNTLIGKNKIIEDRCNLAFKVFSSNAKSFSSLNEIGNITNKKCLDKITNNDINFIKNNKLEDVADFLINKKESGIIILPLKRGNDNLIIVRCLTKIYISNDHPDVKKIFMKEGIDGLSKITKLKEELSWQYRYIVDYIPTFKIHEFLNWFGLNTPVELYWNNTTDDKYKFLLALVLKQTNEITMCPMIGGFSNFTGNDINIVLQALNNKNGKKIIILDKTKTSSNINCSKI
jgi:hypothetical protein